MSLEVPESFKEPDDFSAEITGSGKELVVSVRGEIDVLTAPLLWERLAEAMDGAGDQLVLDLSATRFIDSMGLGVIVRAHKRMITEDGHLIVQAPTDQAKSVFSLTGLDQVLEMRGLASNP